MPRRFQRFRVQSLWRHDHHRIAPCFEQSRDRVFQYRLTLELAELLGRIAAHPQAFARRNDNTGKRG